MYARLMTLRSPPRMLTCAATFGSTPNCDCRNYDSQLRPSHLRRICAAVAADKTGSPYNNPKKGQDPGRVAGGHGGGLVKYEPKKPIRHNDNPDGPGIPKEPRA